MNKAVYIAIYIIFINIYCNFLYSEEQVFVGARPLGMGNTFVAIANDGNSIYWNPAGLSLLDHQEVSSMTTDLYGLGLKNNYLGYIYPFADHAVGFAYFELKYDDSELGYYFNKYYLSYSQKFNKNLILGINLKYLTTDTLLDNISKGEANGVGVDLGLLYFFMKKKLSIGILLQDIADSKVTYDNGYKTTVLPQNIKFGIAYKLFNNLLVAADLDDRYHLGIEYTPYKMISFRTGLQKDIDDKEDATYSFGTSIKHKNIQFEYAYVVPPILEPTSYISLSFLFGYSNFYLKVVSFDIENILGSLYKTYAYEKFGTIYIHSSNDEKLVANIKLKIDEFMTGYTEKKVILKPNTITKVDLNAVFNNEVLKLKEDRPTNAKISIEYQINKRKVVTNYSKKFIFYSRNSLLWSKPENICAFITPKTDQIKYFARRAIFNYDVKDYPYIHKNILRAIVLFDALGAYGSTYIPDSTNPFSKTHNNKEAIDSVQFPVETLSFKSGDCDDCVVLYASLLENVGIQTALLDVPGHIFMMFNSGIKIGNLEDIGSFKNQLIDYNGYYWIPVECTNFGSNFKIAWENAANVYHKFKNLKKVKIIDVHNMWEKAKPLNLRVDEKIEIPDKSKINKLTKVDLEYYYSVKIKNRIDYYISRIKKEPENYSLKNRLGIFYGKNSMYKDAISIFNDILRAHPDSSAYNNLANIYLKIDNYELAEQNYLKAIELNPNNAKYYFNLGCLYYKLKRFSKAKDMLIKSMKLNPGYVYLYFNFNFE